MDLNDIIEDHTKALDEFSSLAGAVPPDRWHAPRAPDKWSPAQETRHLSLSLAAFNRELRGEGSVRLRGRAWQRWIARRFFMPRMLEGRWTTRRVRAPRETRPEEVNGSQDELLAELADQCLEFETLVHQALQRRRVRMVTHPYFGPVELPDMVRLSAAHIRHHADFVRQAVGRNGTRPAG